MRNPPIFGRHATGQTFQGVGLLVKVPPSYVKCCPGPPIQNESFALRVLVHSSAVSVYKAAPARQPHGYQSFSWLQLRSHLQPTQMPQRRRHLNCHENPWPSAGILGSAQHEWHGTHFPSQACRNVDASRARCGELRRISQVKRKPCFNEGHLVISLGSFFTEAQLSSCFHVTGCRVHFVAFVEATA